MAGNYFAYASAAGGTYGTQSGYAAGQAAFVAAGQAFAAAAASGRSAFQTFETVTPGSAYTFSARPAVVTVAVGPQYHQAGAAGYDPALFSAATTYYRQPQQSSGKPAAMAQLLSATSAVSVSKKLTSPAGYAAKSKDMPRPSQLHFCDVCKIGCLGPQLPKSLSSNHSHFQSAIKNGLLKASKPVTGLQNTYREHLEGQRHKKKEAALSAATAASKTCPTELRCDLCTIVCTGAEAYAAHIRGSKHQRVLKLYAKLGKPVPEDAPAVVSSDGSASPLEVTGAVASAGTSISCSAKSASIGTSASGTVRLPAAASLRVQPVVLTKSSDDDSADTDISESTSAAGLKVSETSLAVEKPVGAVGQEYVEELRTEDGKVVSFHCKLCNCKFNDPNAKEMHVKGRRHRMQYKKKVDPNLDVDVKASVKKRRFEAVQPQSFEEEFIPMAWEEGDLPPQAFLPDGMSPDDEEQQRGGVEEPHYAIKDQTFCDGGHSRPRWPPASAADRLVRAKHDDVYPTEAELFAVQSIVAACEAGLKLVSDRAAAAAIAGREDGLAERPPSYIQEEKVLRSVVRVGALAKGLLLTGHLDVELVLLCTARPTRQLLDLVAELLPAALKDVSDEEYEVSRLPEEAAVRVSRVAATPAVACTITLTSPVVRLDCAEELTVTDPPDVLDRRKCLAALAAHRRAKWFEANAAPLPACVVVLRILKDMRKSVEPLAALSEWAVELLVEHSLGSAPAPMGLCGSLRRLWECIASGLLLPGGPGLPDPCEKEQVDATEPLSLQQRDDLTAFAQWSLRMIAFKKLPQLLNINPLDSDDITCGTKAKRARQQVITEQDSDGSAGEVKRNKSML